MPGRIQIADVSSDGFPDIMLTAVNKSGGTMTAILMNSPCIQQYCSSEARDTMRRVFLESRHAAGKFATDELEIDPRAFLNDVFQQTVS
jgi:flavin reductase (DIM6/NTAB) family NADH-FMN oxidoreductase RutF